MVALPPAEGIIRLVPQFTWQGERCNYVLHYKADLPIVAQDLVQLAIGWNAGWGLFAKAETSNTVNLDYLSVIDLSTNPLAQYDHVPSQPNAGTRASPSLPNNCSIACAHRTAQGGRSFRGRTYWVGLCEDQVTANALGASSVAGIINFWNNVRAVDSGSAADFWDQVILSYYAGGAVRPTPIATPVVSTSINPTMDSMRRRLPGRS
jgi:hypothetical protein